MSIRTKLTLLITLVVTIVLSLNISIYYYSTKKDMQDNARQQMLDVALQIKASVQSTEKFRQQMEEALGERLRLAAISAKEALGPKIEDVTNTQLVLLSQKLGVEGLTLWQRQADGDIVAKRSSKSAEVGISSKSWSYWFTAFTELFDYKDVLTVPEGSRASHYWTGPINFATTDISKVYKWGDYYDGTTDYMINPFVDASSLLQFEEDNGTNAVIRTILRNNPNILEITGIDPEFFGKPIIWKVKQGKRIQNLDVRQVPFGSYKLRSEANDLANVKQAVELGEQVSANETVAYQGSTGGTVRKHVIKSFLPIVSDKPYVVSVSFDRGVIEDAVRRQLFTHLLISVILIVATLFASYFLSGFLVKTLNRIVRKVNEIASGRFGTTVVVKSKDELGLLASRVNLMSGNLQQYTDQIKEAAEDLRSMKEYLESFVNHTSDAIHVTDLKGNVLSVNKAFETMFGRQQDELLGLPLDNVPDDGMQPDDAEFRGRVLGGETITGFETIRLGRNGQAIHLSVTVSGIRDQYGEIISIATISRDITARKHTEEVIRRSEKLNIIGHLAAGVAHEIRNPLTTLRGFAQLMKHKNLSAAHADLMISELDRINFIVSEFLVLSKPQVSRYTPTELPDILRDLLFFLDSQANMSNVRFETAFPEGPLPKLVCEPNQLKQVFLNLLKNAMEAMPDGGVIRIGLECRPDEGYVVRIADEGTGIAPEDLPRLGEPFFTKKSSGTGLGLMVSQQIIANHQGTIEFRSELGQGTTVKVKLPFRGGASAS